MGLCCITDDEAQSCAWMPWLDALATASRATRMPVGDGLALWVAAERLPPMCVMYPDAACIPAIQAPAEFAAQAWSREDAALEIMRSRLSGLGPTTVAALCASLDLPQSDVDGALLRLENEGYVMRGRFTADAATDEWCERHLLARIHRHTIGRLRREIEPVEPRDFMRFLLDWQRVKADSRVSGPDALANVLAQLEGFEAPAGAWETELLPARVSDYSISWLDDLCTAGRVAWTRLRGATSTSDGAGRTAPVRATPIVLLPRRQLALWTGLAAGQRDDDPELSSRAQKVADHLAEHGASFFDELVDGAHLLRTELEDALAELVARGRVHCDSFAGLRALLVPQSRRPSAYQRRGRRAALFGIEDAGRWTLTRRAASAAVSPMPAPEAIEHIARTLLRRYGVVGWRILEREAPGLRPWRDLLRAYHRLEARGDIRGGRFVAGLSGEQFALPEAIAALRQMRRQAHDGVLVGVSAMDPLNLVGTLLAGPKVPRQPGARFVLRDGVPLGALVAGKVELFVPLGPDDERDVRKLLLREPSSQFTPGLHVAA